MSSYNLEKKTTPTIEPDGEFQTLYSFTIPWREQSLLTFLKRANNLPRVYWENDRYPLSFAGFGIAAELRASGPDRFRKIQKQTSHLFKRMVLDRKGVPKPIGPRLFGGFSFEGIANESGIWSVFPQGYFLLPRYLLTRYKGRTWLTVNQVLLREVNLDENTWLLEEALWELPAPNEVVNNPGFLFEKGNRTEPLEIEELVEQDKWQQGVADAIYRIHRGELDKVVLAHARCVRTTWAVDPTHVLARLSGRYPDCFRFLIEPVSSHAFYGASPELLAAVNGRNLKTVALAGSIRRGGTLKEDNDLSKQLMDNPKERSEHAMVAESIEVNLSSMVKTLTVPDKPGILKLSNIQHLQTEIDGELLQDCGILPVVEALHPTPAVGGVPQEAALRYIKEAEPLSRGWYAGPVGWIDQSGNGMFAVAIRSAVSAGTETRLYAGAGIVADSQPEKEWRETDLKFRPLIETLS